MISAKAAEEIVGEELNSKTKISYPCSREVVFLPDHCKMKSFFDKKSSFFDRRHCYLLVHPEYSSQGEHSDYIRQVDNSEDSYETHDACTESIRELIKDIETSNEPSIFLIGFDPFKIYPRDFLPPERSFILFTGSANGRLLEPIEMENNGKIGGVRVQQDNIYSYLRKCGVKEVRVAGKWTWCKENSRNGIGCVRQAAREFEIEGFDVKGVKNCLYPPFPPNYPMTTEELEYAGVTKSLFEKQVSNRF